MPSCHSVYSSPFQLPKITMYPMGNSLFAPQPSIAFPESEVVEAVNRAQRMLGNDWMEAETCNEKGLAPAMRIIGMSRQSYHRSSSQSQRHCSTESGGRIHLLRCVGGHVSPHLPARACHDCRSTAASLSVCSHKQLGTFLLRI